MMKKNFWLPIILGLTAYVALPLPGQGATISSRIDNVKGKIERKKRKEHVLSSTISRYNVRIQSLQGEIRGLQERQQRIQDTLDQKRKVLLDARIKLTRARDRLARLRDDLVVAEKALADRLVEIYKTDEPDILTVVLSADGFGELLERTEFLDRISRQDEKIVAAVRDLKAAAKKQATEMAALEKRAEDAANVILAKRNELASARGRLVDSRQGLQTTRDGRKNILNRVAKSRTRLEGDLRKLQAANARAQGLLQGAGERAFRPGSGGPIKKGSGNLVWPVNGPVVSPFGQRWGRLHAGIDIAVPSGTPIRAADSGRIVVNGVVGGYGNYTCIQHNSSLSTCYAHQSRFASSNGASVSQGDVIGYVGCTGHCFGDHLHFETRVGGGPVDPMGYL